MGCSSAMLSSKFIPGMLSWDNTISYNPQQNGDNSISYNPQQNGVTEKKTRIMVETTNWMLKHVNLPNNLWQKMACDFPLCNSLQCLCTIPNGKHIKVMERVKGSTLIAIMMNQRHIGDSTKR